jgi:transcription termination factor NusB
MPTLIFAALFSLASQAEPASKQLLSYNQESQQSNENQTGRIQPTIGYAKHQRTEASSHTTKSIGKIKRAQTRSDRNI